MSNITDEFMKDVPENSKIRHILGVDDQGRTVLGKGTAPAKEAVAKVFEKSANAANAEIFTAVVDAGEIDGNSYTFPTDLREGEILVIDGHPYDHTYAGKTISIPTGTPAPRREWTLADRISAKEIFERQFGVHRDTRSAAQWQKLIDVYGIKVVCKQEQMDEATVRKHAGETFTMRLKRQLKEKAAGRAALREKLKNV